MLLGEGEGVKPRRRKGREEGRGDLGIFGGNLARWVVSCYNIREVCWLFFVAVEEERKWNLLALS